MSTPGHKYYLPDNKATRNADEKLEHASYEGLSEKWVSAEDLKRGDRVLLSDEKYGIVKSIKTENCEKFTTYNFEVNDFHTYYVGESGILCHNMCAEFSHSDFVDGELFETTAKLADGTTIDAIAEVSISGKHVSLNNITMYARNGSIPNKVGADLMMKWRNSVFQHAYGKGFNSISLHGIRVMGSSSAAAGSVINRTFDLARMFGGG